MYRSLNVTKDGNMQKRFGKDERSDMSETVLILYLILLTIIAVKD